MQPLSFLQLMKNSVLCRLMLITGMQTFTEGRNITDFVSIYLQDELKWSWDKINSFVSVYGMALIVSGMTVKKFLRGLGLRKFTTFSNLMNSLNLLSYARVPPLGLLMEPTAIMYLGMFFGAFGGRKRDGAEAMILRIGSDAGFGNAFMSGAMMNFRAIINVLGPLMFGSLYAWGAKRAYPQIIFLAGVGTIVAAEASLRTLTDDELCLDARGQIIPKGEQKKKA